MGYFPELIFPVLDYVHPVSPQYRHPFTSLLPESIPIVRRNAFEVRKLTLEFMPVLFHATGRAPLRQSVPRNSSASSLTYYKTQLPNRYLLSARHDAIFGGAQFAQYCSDASQAIVTRRRHHLLTAHRYLLAYPIILCSILD